MNAYAALEREFQDAVRRGDIPPSDVASFERYAVAEAYRADPNNPVRQRIRQMRLERRRLKAVLGKKEYKRRKRRGEYAILPWDITSDPTS